MKVLLEICVDTFESAVAAIEGGADRIELCSALSEGGLTPTVGLLRRVKMFLAERSQQPVPVFCMVRCRRGSDFRYSEPELDIMLWDVKLLKEHGADGFVFGALDASGNVHRDHCERLVEAAHGAGTVPLTFHRAIDCTEKSQLMPNIQLIADLGFSTILTSGLKPSAAEGLYTIVQMKNFTDQIKQDTGKAVQLMPGSGVSTENLRTILISTGCLAVHGSASVSKSSSNPTGAISMGATNVDALPVRVCSRSKVEEWRKLIDEIYKNL